MSTRIYKGAEGVEFLIDMQTDLTAASNLRFNVKKPDGTTAVWSAVLSGSTKIKYISVAGDLDKVGVYKLHPYAEIGLFKGNGDPIAVEVFALYA